MAAETCRSGRHSGQWSRTPDGRRYCADCARESQGRRAQSTPRWYDPIHGADVAARLEAWRATVDVAIARVRLTEGFDGTRQGWRTLGECLLPAHGPAMVALLARRRAEERLAS